MVKLKKNYVHTHHNLVKTQEKEKNLEAAEKK